MNLKLHQNILVLCNNMNGYDTQFVIREFVNEYRKVSDLIANTDEKYTNYSISSDFGYKFDANGNPRKFIKLSFFDTFRFMPLSIENLAKD